VEWPTAGELMNDRRLLITNRLMRDGSGALTNTSINVGTLAMCSPSWYRGRTWGSSILPTHP